MLPCTATKLPPLSSCLPGMALALLAGAAIADREATRAVHHRYQMGELGLVARPSVLYSADVGMLLMVG